MQYFILEEGALKGRFRRYEFYSRLSCATSIRHDFRPSTRAQFSLTTPHVSYECHGSNLNDTICREVMTHASRAR